MKAYPTGGILRFTLVELLIVISIIMILSSLLLPALSRAKEAAYQSKCRSNLKQCGTAFVFYADDNNGWLPNNRYSNRIPHNWGYDAVTLVPNYLSKWSMADCPSNNFQKQPYDTSDSDPRCVSEYDYMGYETPNYAPPSAKKMTDDSSSLLVGDAFTDPTEPDSNPLWRNHKGGANWCYLDLHAVWINKSRLGYYKSSLSNHEYIYYHLYPIQ